MIINFAHLRHPQGIDFAGFDADAVSKTDFHRGSLLAELTTRARLMGLKIDKAVLVFVQFRQIYFWGTPDLAQYLANSGWMPRWTHYLNY